MVAAIELFRPEKRVVIAGEGISAGEVETQCRCVAGAVASEVARKKRCRERKKRGQTSPKTCPRVDVVTPEIRKPPATVISLPRCRRRQPKEERITSKGFQVSA